MNHGCTTTINSWAGIQHLSALQAGGTQVPHQTLTRHRMATAAVGAHPCPSAAPLPSPCPQPAESGASDKGMKDWHQVMTKVI